jgi:subtilase family serine protease/flagellar hook assembly protein FlgD/fibronectin type 3 domain-containing protein
MMCRCLRTLLALFAISGHCAAAAAARAEANPLLRAPVADCVDIVDTKALRTPISKAHLAATVAGNLVIVDYAGGYGRDDTVSQREVSHSVYSRIADDYDFLVVFTTFEFDTGTAFAYYTPIRNSVAGIGLPPADVGQSFGSPARLQGIITMAALARHEFNPSAPSYDATLDTLAHEIMHRWAVYPRWRNPEGAIGDELLGAQSAHWSYFVDSHASVMYGGDWRERAAGEFESADASRRYNEIELYLAGFVGASEAGSLRLIRGATGDRNARVEVGARIRGSAVPISVADIAAAEGPRVPSASDSQRRFRAAMVLVRRPGESIDAATLTGLEQLRVAFERRFAQFTGGRAALSLALDGVPAVGGTAVGLSGSGPTATPPGIDAALEWVKARQRADGSWADHPSTAIRDTAAAIALLAEREPSSLRLADARNWLAARTPATVEQSAWRLAGLAGDPAAAISSLLAMRADGQGWGLRAGWQESPYDGALALTALSARGTDRGSLSSAAARIAGARSGNGFAPIVGARAGAAHTARVLATLDGIEPARWRTEIDAGRAWLAAAQRPDGGFGSPASALYESAIVLAFAASSGLPTTARDGLRGYLRAQQQRSGDFGGSVFVTATVALGLTRDQRPNLAMPNGLSITPTAPIDGIAAQLRTTVFNLGSAGSPAARVRFFDGDPAAGGVRIGADVDLPPLTSGASATASTWWDTFGRQGAHRIHALVDPEAAIEESSESDNTASVDVAVAAPSALPDLTVDAASLVVTPNPISTLPTNVRIAASIRNVGSSAASAVRVRALARRENADVVLAEATIEVAGRASVPVALDFALTDSRITRATLIVDALESIAEADESNNRLELALPVATNVDLAIAAADITPLSSRIIAGSDAQFRVRVRNLGTSDSPTTQLKASVRQGSQELDIAEPSIAPRAGGFEERTLTWRPTSDGSAVLRIELDPRAVVLEADESNNRAEFSFSIGRSEQANLAIVSGSLAATPSPALQGSPLTVRGRLSNLGGAPAASFRVGLYDGDPRAGGTQLAQTTIAGPLDAGAERDLQLVVPDFPAPERSFLHLVLDDGAVVAESDESDNIVVVPLEVLPLADVAVSLAGIRILPALPVRGQVVTASVTVSNLGGQIAREIDVGLREGEPDTGTLVGPVQRIAELAPGASAALQWQWTFGLVPNAVAISVVADPSNTVRERSDTNNSARLPIDVQSGDMFASDRWFSPNGDGVKDEIVVVFRSAGAASPSVDIVNAAGRIVRSYRGNTVARDADRAQVLWDGRDDTGSIVPDADYRIVAFDDGGQSAPGLLVTVDTNRSSPLDAIGTRAERLTRLPSGFDRWRIGVGSELARNRMFAIGRVGSNTSTPPGIYWIDPISPAPQPIVTPRWIVAEERRIGGGADVEIVNLVPLRSGDALAFTARITGVTGCAPRCVSVYRTRIDAIDAPVPIVERINASGDYVAEITADTLLVGPDPVSSSAGFQRVDLATRTQTPFPNLPESGSVLALRADGLILGRRGSFDVPTWFVPYAPGRTPVRITIPQGTIGYRAVRINSSGSHAYVQYERAGGWPDFEAQEFIDLIDLTTNRSATLHTVRLDTVSVPRWDGGSSARPASQLRAAWNRSSGELLVLDGKHNQLLRFSETGAERGAIELGVAVRAGAYAATAAAPTLLGTLRSVRGVVNACDADVDWMRRADSRRWFDQAASAIYLSTAELVAGFRDDGYDGDFAFGEGVLDYQRIEIENQRSESIRRVSTWPLVEPGDRIAYPLAGVCASNRPPHWPDWILPDGSRLRIDGRPETPAGLGPFWSHSKRVIDLWPDGSRLILDDADVPGQPRRVLSSLLNGAARLDASSSGLAISLEGVAVDRNLDFFEIEWARVEAPTLWRTAVPPTRTEIIDEEFLQWVAPAPGAYLFRLRVVDKAGNVSIAEAQAAAAATSPIREAQFSPRYISPNGDGVQDALVARFTVGEPATVDFVVRDSTGSAVRTVTRSFATSELGAAEFRWDGRREDGVLAPDGNYVLGMAGWRFLVIVDSTPPSVTAKTPVAYPPRPFDPVFANAAEFDVEAYDDNPARAVVETSTPDAGDSWSESLARVIWRSLSGEARSPLALPFDDYARGRVRVRATDLAGNVTLLAPLATVPRVIAMQLRGRLIEGRGSYLSFQEEPFQTTSAPPFPARLEAGGDMTLSVRNLTFGLDAIALEVSQSEQAPQFREIARWRVTTGTCGTDSSCITQDRSRQLTLPLRLPDTDPRGKYVVRSVGYSASGALASNQTELSFGGIESVVDCAGQWRHERMDSDARAAMLRLYAQRDALAWRTANFIAAIEYQVGSLASAELEFEETGARFSAYALDDRLVAFAVPRGLSGPYQITGVDQRGVRVQTDGMVGCGGRTQFEPFLVARPVIAPECGSGTTNRLRIVAGIGFVSSAPRPERMRVCFRNPITGSDNCILDQELSRAGAPARFLGDEVVETTGWPESRVRMHAEGLRGGTWIVFPGLAGEMIVDKRPPTVALEAPADGQRVCARESVAVRGAVRGDSPLEYRISIVRPLMEPPLDCRTGNGAVDGLGIERACLDYTFIADLRARTRLGQLLSFSAGDPSETNGPQRLQLSATDWSGGLTCSESTPFLDTLAEMVERAPATHQLIEDTLGLSRNGAAKFRSVRFAVQTREPLRITAQVHRRTATGALEPAELATFFDRSGLIGPVDIVWDGTGAPGDGDYAIRLIGTDACGYEKELRYFVRVDSTPPEVSISSPARDAVVSAAAVDIHGGFSDRHFDEATLSVNDASGATSQQLGSYVNPRPAESLLATWNRGERTRNATFRLGAVDLLGNRSEITHPIVLADIGPMFRSARREPDIISPNGDGVLDSTRIEVDLRRAATLSARIESATGATLATLANAEATPAGARTLSWNGRGAGDAALPDGNYRIVLVASDAANGVSERQELAIEVDTRAPAVRSVNPEGLWSNGTGNVRGVAEDLNLTRAVVRLVATSGSVATTEQRSVQSGEIFGADLSQVAEGRYRIEVEAEDRAGNRAAIARDFTLDRTPPEVRIDAPDTESVLRAGSAFDLLGAIAEKNLADYKVLLRNGTTTIATWATATELPASGPLARITASAPEGDYRLAVTATDRAGNTGEQSIALSIDANPPLAQVAQPADDALIGSLLHALGTASDRYFERFTVSLASAVNAAAGAWTELEASTTPVSSATLYRGEVPGLEGDYRLRLEVEDRSGQTASSERSLRFDSAPPPAVLDLRGTLTPSREVQLGWSASTASDFAEYWVERDGDSIATTTTPNYLDRSAPEGVVRYRVFAIDRAENESLPSNTVELSIDRTPPEVALLTPRSGERVQRAVLIRGTAASAEDFADYVLSLEAPIGSQAQVLARGSIPVRDVQLARLAAAQLTDGMRVKLVLSASDRNENRASADAEVVIDDVPPAVPTGLEANLTARDVAVRWNPNTESDLLGYLLYRDDQLVNASSAPPGDLRPYALQVTQWPDLGLGDGSYAYRVCAIDQAGNISALSAPASVMLDGRAPEIDIIAPQNNASFEREVEVVASSADRDLAEVRFAWRAAGGVWNPIGSAFAVAPYRVVWVPGSGVPFGSYQVQATATDRAGRSDPTPPIITLRYADLTPPAVPLDLAIRTQGSNVRLTWQSSASEDAVGYHVERTALEGGADVWARLTQQPQAATSYDDANRPDGQYLYRVFAIDRAGNLSEPSLPQSALIFAPTLEQPYTPVLDSTTSLSGASSALGEARSVIGAAAGPSAAVAANGRFELAPVPLSVGVNAIDVAIHAGNGNVSRNARVEVRRATRPAPSPRVVAPVSGRTVNLSWDPSPSPGVIGYRVYRNDRPAAPDRDFDWRVSAASANSAALGNPPAAIDANPATAWRPRVSFAPAAPSALALEIGWATPRIITAVTLNFTAAREAATDVDIAAWTGSAWVNVASLRNADGASLTLPLRAPYRTTRLRILPLAAAESGVETLALAEVIALERPLIESLLFADTVTDGRYRYRVGAVNDAAFESDESPTATADVGDAEPPAPVTLSGELSGRDATLTWSASTSADVARYELRRDASVVTSIAASDARRYVDSNLANGSYRYRVVAYDGFDNASAESNAVTLTVASEVPGAPLDLVVTAPPIGKTLDLSWRAPAGAVPARYVLRRGDGAAGPFTEIARPTATTYRDSGLQNGRTYHYVVAATDAAGNIGATSAPASGTPRDRQAPDAPVLTAPTIAGVTHRTSLTQVEVCGISEPAARLTLRLGERELVPLDAAPSSQIVRQPQDWARRVLRVSGDGRRILSLDAAGVARLLEPSTGTERVLSAVPTANLIEWAPDRDRFYFVDQFTGTLRRYEIADNRLTNLQVQVSGAAMSLSVAPGNEFGLFAGSAFGGGADGVALWAIDLRGSELVLRRVTGGVSATPVPGSIHWHRAGRQATLVDGSGTLWLIDLAESRSRSIDAGVRASGAVWSPDGATLAYVRSNPGAAFDLVARNVESGATRVLQQRAVAPPALSFSPEGERLGVLAESQVELIDMRSGALIERIALGLAGARALHWSSSQYLIASGDSVFAQWQPAGAFCAEMPLATGINIVDAAASDDSGNASLRSAPIEIERLVVGDLPDLALSASEIRFVPAAIQPGQLASLQFSVANRGRADASPTALLIALRAPDGSVRELARGTATTAIAPGDSQRFSIATGALTAIGAHRADIRVDPENRLAESDEANNSASSQLIVSSDTTPLLSALLDAATFPPGTDVTGELSLDGVGASFNGRVRARVHAPDDTAVATLLDLPIERLAAGQRWRQRLSWSPDVFAGEYFLVAELQQSSGTIVSSQRLRFEIEAWRNLRLSLSSDRPQYVLGSQATINYGVDYEGGNVPLAGARVEVTIRDAADGVVFRHERSLGTLLPGVASTDALLWVTTGRAAGVYRALLSFRSGPLVESREFSITLLPPGERGVLTGAISVDPSTNLLPRQSATARAVARNATGAALSDLDLRLRVFGSDASAALGEKSTRATLAADAESALDLDLGAVVTALAPYRIVFDARRADAAPDAWEILAAQTVRGIDLAPPEIEIELPRTEQIVSPRELLLARIFDRHSDVARAQVRFDAGTWRSLGLQGDGRYGRALAALADGAHRAELSAVDAWGNEATISNVSFVIDGSPPEVTISGVADGAELNRSVTPLVTVVDASPVATTLTLNGSAVAAGTAIDRDGDYVFEARAVDAANNVGAARVSFRIDRTAPTVTFTAPAAGSTVRSDSVDVRLVTEASAAVSLTVGTWSGQAVADASGTAAFNAVPLVPGSNALDAVARDRAGNNSPTARITVTREPGVGGPLLGDVQPASSTIAAGESLRLTLTVRNRSGAARPQQALQLRILAFDGSVLATQSWTRDLASDELFTATTEHPTASWAAGQITAVLEARDGASWAVLDAEAIQLVDRTPPSLRRLAPPADSVLRGPIQVRAEASDAHGAVDVVEYQLDEGNWTALTRASASGAIWESAALELVDAAHLIAVRARDGSGNTALSARERFVVDNTPPAIEFDGVAEGALRNTPVTPTFVVTDRNPDRVSARLDGQPFNTGAIVSADGDHVLEVEAIDRAGNRAQRQLRFTIDRTPPMLAIDTPLNESVVFADRVLVRGRSEAAASVRVDAGAFSAVTIADSSGSWGIPDVSLVPGPNTLRAVASDRAGNQSAPAQVTVRRGAQAGITLSATLRAVPEEVAAGSEIRLEYTIVNSGSTTASAVPLRIAILGAAGAGPLAEAALSFSGAPGENTAGNVRFLSAGWPLGARSASVEAQLNIGGSLSWTQIGSGSFVVADRTPPVLTVEAPLADSYASTRLTIVARARDELGRVSRVEARLANGLALDLTQDPAASERWQGEFANPPEGTQQLALRAFDDAGNLAQSAPRTVHIDRTPPAIGIDAVVDGALSNRPLSPTWRALDASPVTLTATLNGAIAASGATITADGDYRLVVDARDAAGNVSSATRTFTIDTVAPPLRISFPGADAVIEADNTLVTGRTEALARVELTRGSFAANTTADARGDFRFDSVPLELGTNVLTAFAIDRAGNRGNPASVSVRRRAFAASEVGGGLVAPATVRRGDVLDIALQLLNRGTDARPGVPWRLTIERASNGVVLAQREGTADLAPAATMRRDERFVTEAWAAETLTLRLAAQLSGANGSSWVSLDAKNVVLQGRQSLSLVILEPQNGSAFAQAVARIVARTEPAALVTARRGTQGWQTRADGSGSASFVDVPLEVGANQFELTAVNALGDFSPTARVSIVRAQVSSTPRQIPIDNPASLALLLAGTLLLGLTALRRRRRAA